MPKTTHSGLTRLRDATRFSVQGLISTFRHEHAFRQECVLLVASVPLAAWVANSVMEFTLLVSVVLLMMVVELMNSAVESVVDRISGEHHLLSGRAKDQASAAVMLTALIAGATWLAVWVG